MKTIYFKKKDGKVSENVNKAISDTFSLLGNGEYVLTIKKPDKSRSLQQNRMMWLWFACIQDETGQDLNDIHDYYCSKFLQRKMDWTNEPITGTTRNLDTKQFAYFMQQIQADAASDFGIQLPDPSDLCWGEFEEQYKHYLR